MAAYATPAQLMQRYDVRVLGDLASDNGVRVDQPGLVSNTNIQAALDDASGEIEAALLQGERYTTSDLSSLTGNSAKYLVRLTCKIAFGLLWERRPWSDDDDRREQAMDQARKALDQLRKGEHVFDVAAVKDAGLPAQRTPSVTTITNLNLGVDRMRGHYYPRRHFPQ